MPGIFKKLNASDVKITPFEAHKQYNTTNLASIGAQTASLHWSGLNKETFTKAQNRYYQIDKLYYRNYIQERAHRIELDDATYTTQERRLYQSASIVSLSQKTFGSEVQPNTFNLSIIAHGVTSSFADDGFGNIYDTSTNLGKVDFPNEDNRVFYLSPVNSFKRADLNLDIETGNTYVSTPYPNGFSGNFSDNSYFVNPIKYNNIEFKKGSGSFNDTVPSLNKIYGIQASQTSSLVQIPHRGTLNFNKGEEFTICFYYNVTNQDQINANRDQVDKISFKFSGGGLGQIINTSSIEHNNAECGRRILIKTHVGEREFYLAFSGSSFVAPTDATGSALFVPIDLVNQDSDGNGVINAHSASLAFTQSLNLIDGIDLAPLAHNLPIGTVGFKSTQNIGLDTNISSSLIGTAGNLTASLQVTSVSTASRDYYIITKEGTKTAPDLPSEGSQHTSLQVFGNSQLGTEPSVPQFPYRIFYRVGETNKPKSASLFFERYDGEITQVVSSSFFTGEEVTRRRYVAAMAATSSKTSLTVFGGDNIPSTNLPVILDSVTQGSPTISKSCINKANITLFAQPKPDGTLVNRLNTALDDTIIGSVGDDALQGGHISQLMMWNKELNANEITKVMRSITGTYPVGNLFYDNGFAVITHPKYMDILKNGKIDALSYKNTHLITENEYQCTVNENEFEFTRNISARKVPFNDDEDLANFATGSNFKPYITTIGLYDENANLLVVGKLGQPVRASSETDTTFIIRFDT